MDYDRSLCDPRPSGSASGRPARTPSGGGAQPPDLELEALLSAKTSAELAASERKRTAEVPHGAGHHRSDASSMPQIAAPTHVAAQASSPMPRMSSADPRRRQLEAPAAPIGEQAHGGTIVQVPQFAVQSAPAVMADPRQQSVDRAARRDPRRRHSEGQAEPPLALAAAPSPAAALAPAAALSVPTPVEASCAPVVPAPVSVGGTVQLAGPPQVEASRGPDLAIPVSVVAPVPASVASPVPVPVAVPAPVALGGTVHARAHVEMQTSAAAVVPEAKESIFSMLEKEDEEEEPLPVIPSADAGNGGESGDAQADQEDQDDFDDAKLREQLWLSAAKASPPSPLSDDAQASPLEPPAPPPAPALPGNTSGLMEAQLREEAERAKRAREAETEKKRLLSAYDALLLGLDPPAADEGESPASSGTGLEAPWSHKRRRRGAE